MLDYEKIVVMLAFFMAGSGICNGGVCVIHAIEVFGGFSKLAGFVLSSICCKVFLLMLLRLLRTFFLFRVGMKWYNLMQIVILWCGLDGSCWHLRRAKFDMLLSILW